jgi:hypothetical protein
MINNEGEGHYLIRRHHWVDRKPEQQGETEDGLRFLSISIADRLGAKLDLLPPRGTCHSRRECVLFNGMQAFYCCDVINTSVVTSSMEIL